MQLLTKSQLQVLDFLVKEGGTSSKKRIVTSMLTLGTPTHFKFQNFFGEIILSELSFLGLIERSYADGTMKLTEMGRVYQENPKLPVYVVAPFNAYIG